MKWVSRLLVVAGSAMLAWCAWVVVDAGRSQIQARRALESTAIATVPSSRAASDDPEGLELAVESMRPGSAVGHLSIPRIHLSAVILHGSDAQTLRRGPGHLERTALPGDPGNVVVAGHRDTFFRPLQRIQLGDEIVLDTPRGRFQYRVSSLRVTSPDDVGVLDQGDHEILTLITCYPFRLVGSAPDRFVVRATRVLNTAVTPTSPAPRAAAAVAPPSITTVGTNDEAVVRQAIDRFLATYNARLVSHGELGRSGFLKLQSCRVDLSDQAAAAACHASFASSADPEVRVWTFALGRIGTGWAIRSIAFD